ARPPDAARLRALRPDVSGRPVRGSGARVSRRGRAARRVGPALRPLQHRQGTVQICRRLVAHALLATKTHVERCPKPFALSPKPYLKCFWYHAMLRSSESATCAVSRRPCPSRG